MGLFLSEKVTIDSEKQQTPQYGRMTSDEGEFVFFIPNMEYAPLDDKQERINNLEKKNALKLPKNCPI